MNKLKTRIGWKDNLDKILFMFGSLYFISVSGWWWKTQQSSISQSQPPKQEVIDNSSETSNSPSEDSANMNDSSLPKDGISGEILTSTIPINSDSLPSINISPLPQITPPPANITLPPPPPLSSIPIPPPPLPLPPSVSPTSSVSTGNNPKINTTALVPPPPKLNTVPTINTLRGNTETTSKTENPNVQNTINNPQNLLGEKVALRVNNGHTLIGVIELKDSQGEALFKVNNLTERVKVGDEIAMTGWVLMAINGKQVVVSRQSESVSLQVGETF